MAVNAFTSVRPRGADLDIPAVPPRKTNTSQDRNDAIKRGTSA